jgi:hypothetical protein
MIILPELPIRTFCLICRTEIDGFPPIMYSKVDVVYEYKEELEGNDAVTIESFF